MKPRFTEYVILFTLFAIPGCGTARHAPVTTQRENTKVEVRTRAVFVPDTLLFPLPLVVQERATRDTSSHLENGYAYSDASIDRAGNLHHSLATKPQNIPVPAERQVEYRDSIVYVEREIKVPEPYPVEAPRALTLWQKFQMTGFWVLAALVAAALAVCYRKGIAAFVGRLIRNFI